MGRRKQKNTAHESKPSVEVNYTEMVPETVEAMPRVHRYGPLLKPKPPAGFLIDYRKGANRKHGHPAHPL